MRLGKILLFSAMFAVFLGSAPARAGGTLGFDVTPVLVEFGTLDVGTSATKTITVTNNGAASLSVTGFVKTGSASITVDVGGGSDPCSTENPTLASGEACTMNIDYAPVAVEDAQAIITFTPNDDGTEAISISVTGASEDNGGGGGCSLSPAKRGVTGLWAAFHKISQ